MRYDIELDHSFFARGESQYRTSPEDSDAVLIMVTDRVADEHTGHKPSFDYEEVDSERSSLPRVDNMS